VIYTEAEMRLYLFTQYFPLGKPGIYKKHILGITTENKTPSTLGGRPHSTASEEQQFFTGGLLKGKL